MLLIIDGSSLLTTNYFATIPFELKRIKDVEIQREFWHLISSTPQGKYNNALRVSLKQIVDIIERQRPEYIAVCLDKGRNSFRRDIYPEYKANRGDKPDPLEEQFESFKEILTCWGIKVYESDRYEGDDYVGSLTERFKRDTKCAIYSKDKDFFQLVGLNVELWKPFNADDYSPATDECPKNTRIIRYGAQIKDDIEVRPESFADFLALCGDKADNIPGCPYIGNKGANELLIEFGSIDEIYREIDTYILNEGLDKLTEKWKALGLKTTMLMSLLQNRETVIISRMLSKIKTNIEIEESLEDLRCQINRGEYYKTISEYCIEELYEK